MTNLIRTLQLRYFRWLYLRKMLFIYDCRKQGFEPGIKTQLDAIELLQKVNLLTGLSGR